MTVTVNMLAQDHDHYMPLAVGDVKIPDVDLRLSRVRLGVMPGMLERIYVDPELQVGEASFARYISRVADRNVGPVMALPAFVVRGFRHRGIYVRRGSKLRVTDLAGKTIGISEWRATGNTWTRAAMSDAGVRTQDCKWLLARADDTKKPVPRDELPANVVFGRESDNLVDLLTAGTIDAFVAPLEPPTFYDEGCPIVRLFDDYEPVERDYFKRTGVYPAHHIVCVKREFFEKHPELTRAIYQGLDESKQYWDAYAKIFGQVTPWLLREIEGAQQLMGHDWRPYGLERNTAMMDALCRELFEQGLVSRRVDPAELFPDFEKARW